MYVLTLDKDYLVVVCLCGQRHTYYFNYGSCESKPGPFTNIIAGDWIDFRFDSDFGNEGAIERVTLEFPNYSNISTDQMVDLLNTQLQGGVAHNDFGTVLVKSKATGPSSCVEVTNVSRPNLMGYDARHDTFWHHCCNRLQLGFAPPTLDSGYQRKHKDIIVWRRCRACSGQTSSIRNMNDLSADLEATNNAKQRKAINTLSVYLKQRGYVDYDMLTEFAQETTDPTEVFQEFLNNPSYMEVYTMEELDRRPKQSS